VERTKKSLKNLPDREDVEEKIFFTLHFLLKSINDDNRNSHVGSIDMGEWIEGKGYRKKVLYDEKDLSSKGVRIQIVEIEAGDRVGPHFHESQTEVYNVQEGRAILGIDDVDYEVEEGDTLICKPDQVHYVINEYSETLRLFVVKLNYEEDDTRWKSE